MSVRDSSGWTKAWGAAEEDFRSRLRDIGKNLSTLRRSGAGKYRLSRDCITRLGNNETGSTVGQTRNRFNTTAVRGDSHPWDNNSVYSVGAELRRPVTDAMRAVTAESTKSAQLKMLWRDRSRSRRVRVSTVNEARRIANSFFPEIATYFIRDEPIGRC
jgi:hypothetical protein